jgi:hypothetical protein
LGCFTACALRQECHFLSYPHDSYSYFLPAHTVKFSVRLSLPSLKCQCPSHSLFYFFFLKVIVFQHACILLIYLVYHLSCFKI